MRKFASIDTPYALDSETIISVPETNAHAGLSSSEALRRLHNDGPNALRVAPRRAAWRQFLLHFQDPFGLPANTTSVLHHLFANKWLWGAIALSLLLQVAVVQLSALNVAFNTSPLSLDHWLFCGVIASMVLWTAELLKLVQRARKPCLLKPSNAAISTQASPSDV